MFFEYNNICYKIWFRHWVSETSKGGVTACYIGTRGDKRNDFVFNSNRSVTALFTATACCHEADTYIKETGRKLSLERACKQANDKAFTKAAFNCYLNRRATPTA